MPVWLQLAAALLAGLAAGIMGKAFIPFLRRARWCEPLTKKQEDEEASGEQLRPNLGGVLLCFGILAGISLGFALFQTAVRTELPEKEYLAGQKQLLLLLGQGGILALGGFIVDVLRIRRRLLYKVPLWMQGLAVYLVTLGMQTALQEEPSLLRTLYVAVCWMLMQGMEETDGGMLAVGTVQLLCIAVLMLAGMLYLPALYALVCAGACMGCMVWCLHPAKCRFGSTGSFLLGGTVPLLLLMTQKWQACVLLMAVCLVNALPRLLRRPSLDGSLAESGMQPLGRIAVFAGAAAVTGAVTLLAVH